MTEANLMNRDPVSSNSGRLLLRGRVGKPTRIILTEPMRNFGNGTCNTPTCQGNCFSRAVSPRTILGEGVLQRGLF